MRVQATEPCSVPTDEHNESWSAADVERVLDAQLRPPDHEPTALHAAMRHAVLGGGRRIRAQLVVAVADACAAADDERELAKLAGCAIEIVHQASRVQDDLPAFDDAAKRCGRPTVHARFGEPVALIATTSLVTHAFELLTGAPERLARRALRVTRLLAHACGSHAGVFSGHGDAEPLPATLAADPITRYHATKTIALFRAAAQAGACAAGAVDLDAWGRVGRELGLAYVLAGLAVDDPVAASDLELQRLQCVASTSALVSAPGPLGRLIATIASARSTA